MKREVTLLVAEDDPGHARLIEKNLRRAGLCNPIRHFRDGQEVLSFLEDEVPRDEGKSQTGFVLLLDIKMPKMDGITVLRRVKQDARLHKMPVCMLTTTDDPREIARCHELGCNHYVRKPIEQERFVEVLRQLGLFLAIVEVPDIRSQAPSDI